MNNRLTKTKRAVPASSSHLAAVTSSSASPAARKVFIQSSGHVTSDVTTLQPPSLLWDGECCGCIIQRLWQVAVTYYPPPLSQECWMTDRASSGFSFFPHTHNPTRFIHIFFVTSSVSLKLILGPEVQYLQLPFAHGGDSPSLSLLTHRITSHWNWWAFQRRTEKLVLTEVNHLFIFSLLCGKSLNHWANSLLFQPVSFILSSRALQNLLNYGEMLQRKLCVCVCVNAFYMRW